VAFVKVVLRPEAAPVRERLRTLLRGRVEVPVNPVAPAEEGHRCRTGVRRDRSPSGRVSERAAQAASDLPAGGWRSRVQPGERAGGPEVARFATAGQDYDEHNRGEGE